MRKSIVGRALGVAAVLGAMLVVPTATAAACSCALVSVAEGLTGSDAVFSGVVTRRDDPGGGSSVRLVAYQVTVDRVFKGSVASTITVRSAAAGDSCGSEYLVGRREVVFASGSPGDLRSSLCDPTAQLDDTQVIAELGTGHPPVTLTQPAPQQVAAPGTPRQHERFGWTAALAGVAGAAVAGAAFVLARKRLLQRARRA